MALSKRALDGFRPTNSIEPIFEPVEASRAPVGPGPSESPAKPQAARADAAGGQAKSPAYLSEPDTIAKRYYVEEKAGERQYFEDYKRTNLAMRATETSVSSKREDLNTIKAMFEIAEARGWHSVEIKGSAEFKREAWIEATARGLEGRGFSPSDSDRQEADRRRAERGHANEVRATERAEAQTERAAGHPAALESQANAKPMGETFTDNWRVIRHARDDMSADGRLLFAALSEKIDREMTRIGTFAKSEIKRDLATELLAKEKTEGPIVFSPEQKRAASAPAPVQTQPPAQTPSKRVEPEAPRRSLSR